MSVERENLDDQLRHCLCIGIDLDMTLIDTRAATAHALGRVNERHGFGIDVEAVVSNLGPPLKQELSRWVATESLDEAVRCFREYFLTEGLSHLAPLPGALLLASVLRDGDRRLVVITSRIPPIATACLKACGLEASAIVGNVAGREKGPAIKAHSAAVYVGDHTLDMAGAQEANVPGIGVTTGSHTSADLRAAGAIWVVDSLERLATAFA